ISPGSDGVGQARSPIRPRAAFRKRRTFRRGRDFRTRTCAAEFARRTRCPRMRQPWSLGLFRQLLGGSSCALSSADDRFSGSHRRRRLRGVRCPAHYSTFFVTLMLFVGFASLSVLLAMVTV